MKMRATTEFLGMPATIVTGNLPKDTLMAITGNRTVDKAGANANAIGRLVVPSKTDGGLGTVETKFKELIECKTAAIVAAGALVKLGAPDGTTGENTVTTWVSGTDGFERLYGVVWNGAASGGVAEILTY